MMPTRATGTTLTGATLAFIAVMSLSIPALAETCTVEDTTTNSKFQIECETDPSKLPPAQWSRYCKLPTSPQHQLLAASERPPSSARPCKDLNDTNCYSLVTLECR